MVALCRAGETRQQGQRDSGQCVDQTRGQAAARAVSIADLGSRVGDGSASSRYIGDGHQGLLLRSVQPLATGVEREHQRTSEAIFSQGNGSIRVDTGAARRWGKALERTAKENTKLRNASGAFSSNCCNDRLNPQSEADISSRPSIRA